MKWEVLLIGKSFNNGIVEVPSQGDNSNSFRSLRDTSFPEKMKIFANLYNYQRKQIKKIAKEIASPPHLSQSCQLYAVVVLLSRL